MEDNERKQFEAEISELKVKVAQLEQLATQRHNLAEAYRAQLNAIVLILKSPVG